MNAPRAVTSLYELRSPPHEVRKKEHVIFAEKFVQPRLLRNVV